MNYTIEKLGTRIEILLSGIAGREQPVLAALRRCLEASAPGAEPKLRTLGVNALADTIQIELRPARGHRLDPLRIARCLDQAAVELDSGRAGSAL